MSLADGPIGKLYYLDVMPITNFFVDRFLLQGMSCTIRDWKSNAGNIWNTTALIYFKDPHTAITVIGVKLHSKYHIRGFYV